MNKTRTERERMVEAQRQLARLPRDLRRQEIDRRLAGLWDDLMTLDPGLRSLVLKRVEDYAQYLDRLALAEHLNALMARLAALPPEKRLQAVEAMERKLDELQQQGEEESDERRN